MGPPLVMPGRRTVIRDTNSRRTIFTVTGSTAVAVNVISKGSENSLRCEDGSVQLFFTTLARFCGDVVVGTTPALGDSMNAPNQRLENRVVSRAALDSSAVCVTAEGDRPDVMAVQWAGALASEQLLDGAALTRQPSECSLIVDSAHVASPEG
jgi:hypothetical protein